MKQCCIDQIGSGDHYRARDGVSGIPDDDSTGSMVVSKLQMRQYDQGQFCCGEV